MILRGGAVSYERGTPAQTFPLRYLVSFRQLFRLNTLEFFECTKSTILSFERDSFRLVGSNFVVWGSCPAFKLNSWWKISSSLLSIPELGDTKVYTP